MKNFEFEFKKPGDLFEWDDQPLEEYIVQLPHSCDEWVITATKSKEEAISNLEDFIKQATEILEKLKNES